MKRRFELFLETERLTIRNPRPRIHYWCEPCGDMVEMLPIDVASASSLMALRALYTFIEDGKLHFLERADGSLLVCARSFARLQNGGT